MATKQEHLFDLMIGHRDGWRRLVLNDAAVLGASPGADHRDRRWESRHCRVSQSAAGVRVVSLQGEVYGQSARGVLGLGQVCWIGATPAVCVAGVPWSGGRAVELGGYRSADPRVWGQLAEAALIARSEHSVLIQGDTGTGKELLAGLIHSASSRSRGPFVALNCGAIPADLVEAELFGARRGAFTGAVADRKGAFQRAHGGTLFLDELGELSASAQAALLRALDSGQIQVVGGQSTAVDVRVVAATHRDLESMVRRGRFRLDLLHRLAVTQLRTLPLRQRRVDLCCLLEAFVDRQLPPGVAPLLAGHPWQGNVRELRNVAHRLSYRRPLGALTLDDLRRAMGGSSETADRRAWVQACLSQSDSTADAHRISGLPRSTFFRYVKQLRLTPDLSVS